MWISKSRAVEGLFVDAVGGDGDILFLKLRVFVAFQIIQSNMGLHANRSKHVEIVSISRIFDMTVSLHFVSEGQVGQLPICIFFLLLVGWN
jgi:hypothetical protein